EARIHYQQGEAAKSLEEAQRSLEVAEALGERGAGALSLNQMGLSSAALGRTEEAAALLERALALFREIGDPREEVSALYDLARPERDRGRVAEARGHVEDALRLVESLRTGVASPALRAAYFAVVQKHHELYIDLLMRQHAEAPGAGLAAAAFEASERARAR